MAEGRPKQHHLLQSKGGEDGISGLGPAAAAAADPAPFTKAALRFRALAVRVVTELGLDVPVLEQWLPAAAQRSVLVDIRWAGVSEAGVQDGPRSLGEAQYHRWVLRSPDTAAPPNGNGNGAADPDTGQPQMTDGAAESAEKLAAILGTLEGKTAPPCIAMYPGSNHVVPASKVAAQLHFDLGRHNFRLGHHAAAAAHFSRAAVLAPAGEPAPADADTDTYFGHFFQFSTDELHGFQLACASVLGGPAPATSAAASASSLDQLRASLSSTLHYPPPSLTHKHTV